MKGIKRKAKEVLIAHGIRYMEKQGVGLVKLSHIKTPDLVNMAARLSESEATAAEVSIEG